MKRILTHSALLVVLALGVGGAPAAFAGKDKHSAAHVAAIKKCKEDYAAAVKAADEQRGIGRSRARAAAKKAEMECLANAPQ